MMLQILSQIYKLEVGRHKIHTISIHILQYVHIFEHTPKRLMGKGPSCVLLILNCEIENSTTFNINKYLNIYVCTYFFKTLQVLGLNKFSSLRVFLLDMADFTRLHLCTHMHTYVCMYIYK